ncbi:MAG: endonuclease/exonuclease/phosphatase family protein [Anaerolineae bacterium]|nr:endonuclease/exonuclease/phosphatase family protein [Anaerolineae bacterium]
MRRETTGRVLWLIEVGAIGWFFIQAVRLLLGVIYAHVSSADIVLRLGDPGPNVPGVVLPEVAQAEAIAVLVATLLPLLAFLLDRRPVAFVITGAAVAVGRVFMTLDAPLLTVLGAAIALAGGLLYLAALARQQPTHVALLLTLGLTLDQVVRAFGQTLDLTWSESFLPVQTALSIGLFVVIMLRNAMLGEGAPFARVTAHSGISIWGGLALGSLLYLECALLAVPNAVAHWTGIEYPLVAPLLIAVTALPLVPEARDAARRFLTLVDAQWRGWFWLVVVGLLVVVGNRFNGLGALAALIAAQFLVTLLLWWIVRPVGKDERDLTGPGLVLAGLVLAVLFGADFFTYEYAFVRDFGAGLNGLSDLLRTMRGLGLAVALVAVALACTPLMESERRIPWLRGKLLQTVTGMTAVLAGTAAVAFAARPPEIAYRTDLEQMRVATYNLHGGYSLYFDYDLSGMAETIWASGADVVLLQEVDGGRLVSYGVDQALWLGRRLGMDVRFLPTNENLQGLAVLSRMPITLDEGMLLPSLGFQTGVQRVQVRPDDGVLDVYNTWLGLLFAVQEDDLALQEQDQWQQLQEVLRLISTDHPGGVVGRVILGGTFNNTPESPVYAQMQQTGFNDPFADTPLEDAATLQRGAAFIARFDYLWLRNVLPIGRDVLEIDASDHRLAVVELTLSP